MSETTEEKAEDLLGTPFEELNDEQLERLAAFAGVAQHLAEATELFDEIVKNLVLNLFNGDNVNVLLNVVSLRVIIEGIEILVEKRGIDLANASPDNIRGLVGEYLSAEGIDLGDEEEDIISAFEEVHRRRKGVSDEPAT
jgi:hypothetical protein